MEMEVKIIISIIVFTITDFFLIWATIREVKQNKYMALWFAFVAGGCFMAVVDLFLML